MQDSKRFFGFIVCFFVLFVSLTGGTAQAACPVSPEGDLVKIAGHAYTAPTIQEAYNYASNTLNLPSFTLQLVGGIFTGDVVIDGGAVEFDGGYDCSFSSKVSSSSIFGTITITSTGSLVSSTNTDSPNVVSTDQCAFDNDTDGYTSIGSCTGSADDCNDNDFAINPGASEICDGLDNNCDGQIDEGLTGTDADGDGYYAIGSCGAVADDCNDSDATINPSAPDIPYDGIDQDCSGADSNFDFNANACADCHVPDNALESVHSSRAAASAPNGTCVLCHPGQVGSILSGHYGITVRTTDNNVAAGSTINCWTCHDVGVHFGGLVLGDGQGDVWNDVSPPYPNQYSCDNCHANRSARHDSATAHNNRVIDSSCANCHTSDTTVLGSPGTGSLTSASDVDALHGVAQVTDCALCHNYSGTQLDKAVVLTAIRQGLSGTQISCLDCHTDKGTNHGNFEHPIEVGPGDLSYNPGQLCSDCHVVANWAEIEGTEHNVDTNGAGSCATCHNSSRQIVQNVIADAPSNGGYPIRCLACHADKELVAHGSVDHVSATFVTRGTSFCLDCHDPGTAANATVDITHNGTCSLCHTTIPALQPGVPAGGGDCVTCHIDNPTPGTNDWYSLHVTNPPDHSALVTTAGTDNCASCHADALIDVTTHLSDCSNCHNASDGSLRSLAIGQTFAAPGGNCETCHTDGWEVTHTINTPDHGILVRVDATSCGDCHDDTFISAAANTHNGCDSCHNTNGSPKSSAVGKDLAIGGDCTTCHGVDYFDSHTHTHDVSYNPLTDTSQVTQQGCATCHNDSAGNLATFADIVTEHGTCSRCHDYTDDGNGTPPQLTVETTIASGTGVTCATCHTPKVPNVDHGVDHIASGYVTGEAACLVCHTDPATTFTDSNDAKVHNGCTTCHDAGTNALIGSAVNHGSLDAGFGNPNVCTTCHTGRDWTDHNIDHQTAGYVTLHSECTSCHAATMTAGQDFINPADDEKHNACTSCHAVDGAIATGPVDCSACHSGETGDWTTHAQDHTVLVTQQAECSSCHSATVEYVNFVDPANNVKHDDCYVCHDNTTKLASATAGDCSQCHTANYFDSHTHTHDVSYNPLTDTSQTTQQGCALCHNDSAGNLATFADIVTEHGTCSRCHDYTDDGNGTPPQLIVESTIATGTGVTCATCHTPKVPDVDHGVDHIASGYVTGEAACLVCHTDPATTFTDSNDAKVHNGCTTCHDAGTNALIGSAVNHGSQDAGFGNPNVCTTCHTGRDWTDHNIDHQTAGYVTLHSECTSCHAATMTAGQDFINPADDEKHNACTSCHAADGAIATGPVDCSACHSGETTDWTTHAEDHTLLVTQATGCASCHSATVDYAAFVDPANDVKHDDCYVCHNVTTKLASATAGDCSQCHSDVTGDFATHTTQDHTLLVTQATGCASCHSATVDYANFVDPLNNFKHDSCATCHNATTNAPVATAGDCSQCHSGVTGDFSTHITQDHTTKVTLQTECSSCHTETVDYANFIDAANDKKHDACSSCHNATTNTPVATAGDCSQCHTANYFDSHTHSHTVALGAGDLSNGTSCNNCHDDNSGGLASWTDIYVEHLSDCATCHSSARAEVITAISTGADPTNCLDCHSDKTVAHGSIDHMDTGGGTGYVLVGGTGLYYDSVVEYEDCSTAGNCKTCADCHDPGGAANATVDITHSGNCNLCHTTVPALQPGVPAGGGNCVSCHTPSQHTLWTRYMDTCSRQNGGEYGQPGIACHPGFNNGPGNSFHDAHNPAGGWADRNSATSGLTYPFASNPEMWIPNWPLNPTCNTCHTAPDDDSSGAGCGACHTFPGKGPLHDIHAGKKAGQQDIDCSNCHWNS